MQNNNQDIFKDYPDVITVEDLGIVRKLFSHFTLKNTVFSDVSTNEMY